MIAADLANVQVWVATTPVDMRKSFDGLAEVVRSFLGHDPLSGSLFVFRNKGGHLVVSVPRTPVSTRFPQGSGFRRTTRRTEVSWAIQRGRRFARVQW